MILYLALLALILALFFFSRRSTPYRTVYLFDDTQPSFFVLLRSRSPDSKEQQFITAVKRFAFEEGVELREELIEKTKLPYDFPALLFQGRYLWATVHSYPDFDGMRNALKTHKVRYNAKRRVREMHHRFAVALVTPPPASYAGTHSQASTHRFVLPSDVLLYGDEYRIMGTGVTYSPFLEEQLKRIGGGIADLRSLKPFARIVYVADVRGGPHGER